MDVRRGAEQAAVTGASSYYKPAPHTLAALLRTLRLTQRYETHQKSKDIRALTSIWTPSTSSTRASASVSSSSIRCPAGAS